MSTSTRLIDHIRISAESQRMPGWALFLIALFIFGLAVPFIRLVILEVKKDKIDSFMITIEILTIALFLFLDVWFYALYKNPRNIDVTLFEDRLEVTGAVSPIPIANVNASIGPYILRGVVNGNAIAVPDGEALILEIPHSTKYLKPGLIDSLTPVFKERDRLRIIIGPMITRNQAEAFVEHLNALKSGR